MSEEYTERPQDLENTVGISRSFTKDGVNKDYFTFLKCKTSADYLNLITKKQILVMNDLIYKKFTQRTTGKIFESNCVFEMITKTIPKIYFDFDYKMNHITINEFNTELKQLDDLLNENVNGVDLSRLVYIREETESGLIGRVKSAHVIYYKNRMKKTEQKQLTLLIQDYLKYIDSRVYNNNNLFCLPYNTKAVYKNKREFIPYDDYTKNNKNPYNYLINNITDDNQLVTYTEIYKSIINKQLIDSGNTVDSGNKIKIINIEKCDLVNKLIELLPLHFYKDCFNWKCLIKYLYDGNCDYALFMEHSALQTDEQCSNEIIDNWIDENIKFFKYNVNYILQKIAKQYNILFNYAPFSEEFIEYIKKITGINDIKTQLTDIHIANETGSKKTTELVYKQFSIKIYQEVIIDNTTEKFHYFSYDKTNAESDYKKNSNVSTILKLTEKINSIKNKIIVVKALWGSGKTKHIVNKILEQNKNKKILIVSENNSLNTELTNKLKNGGYDVINHQDKDNIMSGAQIQVCSLESIRKIYQADIVILDEYETICSHFMSNTLNDNDKSDYDIFIKLKELLIESEKVICLDADISLARVIWLEKLLDCKSKKYFLTDNNFKDYVFNYYYSYNQINTQFITEMEHKKLVYCSSSKKQIQIIRQQVRERYKDKNILYICNDPIIRVNDCEYPKEDFIKELESNILKFDIHLLLYTPTITTGISIEMEYFDKLYAIGFNKNCPLVRTFIQMLFRNRNLKNKEINISTLQSLHFNRYNDRSYEKWIEVREQKLINVKYGNYNEDILDKDYNSLRIINAKEKAFSERAFTQDFYTRLKQHNIPINNVYLNTKDSFHKDYNEASLVIKEQKLLELENSKVLTDKEIETLKCVENKTYEEKIQLTKHYLLLNISPRARNILLNTEKELPLYDILLKNNELFKTTFKLYMPKKIDINLLGGLQHLTNTDDDIIQTDIIKKILQLFNINSDYTAINTNVELKNIIESNRDFIINNFNDYQTILDYENKTDFMKSTDLLRDTKLFMKRLGKYGITTGYLKSINKKYANLQYKHEHNEAINNNPNNKYCITLAMNNFIKKDIFQYTEPNTLITIKEPAKNKFILYDYINNKFNSLIDKNCIKSSDKKRVVINGKRTTPKFYKEQMLYKTEFNKYVHTKIDTKIKMSAQSSNSISLKFIFCESQFIKSPHTETILTNKQLPIIHITNSNFNDVLNELTSVYGIINSNKKIINKNYNHKIKDIIYRNSFTDRNKCLIYESNIADNESDEIKIIDSQNYNIIYFDYELELSIYLEARNQATIKLTDRINDNLDLLIDEEYEKITYKKKYTIANEHYMEFSYNHFVVSIEY